MRTLAYLTGFYLGCTALFVAAVIQAARRDNKPRPQVPTMPTQRPPVEDEDPKALTPLERGALVVSRSWAMSELADDEQIAREVYVAWLREVA